jgi:hypothetical protein
LYRDVIHRGVLPEGCLHSEIVVAFGGKATEGSFQHRGVLPEGCFPSEIFQFSGIICFLILHFPSATASCSSHTIFYTRTHGRKIIFSNFLHLQKKLALKFFPGFLLRLPQLQHTVVSESSNDVCFVGKEGQPKDF